MKKVFLFLLLPIIFAACDDETTPNNSDLTLNISGLEDLGANARYEGWVIVNGNPISTGTFTVNATGQLSQTTFTVNEDNLQNASAFVLTIEPVPDLDAAPSKIKILAGDFSGSSSSLSIAHASAIGTNLSTASGVYILATPTNGPDTDELSGVWFINNGMAGLQLPMLPEGWIYEGWTVVGSMPLTTGKFTSTIMADNAAPFSGPIAGPNFPGEDYLQNAPAGLTFPLNLQGQKIVLTVEPNPDNDPKPFLLKPLTGDVPANGVPMTPYTLANQASITNPTGTASR